MGDITLETTDWGTRLGWSCSYPPGYANDGIDYELVLVDHAGVRISVATWTGGVSPTTAGLVAATSLTQEQIASIEISAMSTPTALAATTL